MSRYYPESYDNINLGVFKLFLFNEFFSSGVGLVVYTALKSGGGVFSSCPPPAAQL